MDNLFTAETLQDLPPELLEKIKSKVGLERYVCCCAPMNAYSVMLLLRALSANPPSLPSCSGGTTPRHHTLTHVSPSHHPRFQQLFAKTKAPTKHTKAKGRRGKTESSKGAAAEPQPDPDADGEPGALSKRQAKLRYARRPLPRVGGSFRRVGGQALAIFHPCPFSARESALLPPSLPPSLHPLVMTPLAPSYVLCLSQASRGDG